MKYVTSWVQRICEYPLQDYRGIIEDWTGRLARQGDRAGRRPHSLYIVWFSHLDICEPVCF